MFNIKPLGKCVTLKETYLLVGGNGFVGINVALKILLQTEHSVVILDDFSNSLPLFSERLKSFFGDRVEICEGGVFSESDLDRAFGKGIQGVLHFAGMKSVPESYRCPEEYFKLNTLGACSVLLKAVHFGVETFIFSSTTAVYQHAEAKCSEGFGVLPESPYGKSKLKVEEVMRVLCGLNGSAKGVALRYFNPAGAGRCRDFFFGDLGTRLKQQCLFPSISSSILREGAKFSIFGTDYPTPDGTCVRDFIHIEDLASAHLAALSVAKNSSGFEVFNIGAARGYSIREVVSAYSDVAKSYGLSFNFEEAARRSGDVAQNIADCTKASKILNWTPSFDLKEMVLSDLLFRRQMLLLGGIPA